MYNTFAPIFYPAPCYSKAFLPLSPPSREISGLDASTRTNPQAMAFEIERKRA
jgi:hypothetical protein